MLRALRRLTILHKLTAKLEANKVWIMNCFSKHNKTLNKLSFLRVNLMRRLAAFDWLYYCATLWKHDRFFVLSDI